MVKDRLDKTIEKLISESYKKQNTKNTIIDKLNRIEKNIRQDSDRIPAQFEEEITLIRISHIFYIEAEKGKTIIMTSEGRFRTRDTLDILEAKLQEYGFFRCHRSYIVNLRYVHKVFPTFNNNYVLKQDGIS